MRTEPGTISGKTDQKMYKKPADHTRKTREGSQDNKSFLERDTRKPVRFLRKIDLSQKREREWASEYTSENPWRQNTKNP